MGTDRNTSAGVGVQHAAYIVTSGMDATVNDESSGVDGVRAVAQLVAVLIDLDQAGCGDLVKQHPIGVDEEMVFGAGHARADMRKDQVGPAVERHQAVTSGQINA